MSKFTAKQKEIVARKLGYEGPMQGFDEFLQSSPALQMKYGMVADKYMAKGGVVRKYAEGGAVSNAANEADWQSMVSRTSPSPTNRKLATVWRDPATGKGVGVLTNPQGVPAEFVFYDETGQSLRAGAFNAPDLYNGASQFGIDLSNIGQIGSQLEKLGISYKPGELYQGTGSDHGIDFEDISKGGLGTAYDWTLPDPNIALKFEPGSAGMATALRQQQERQDLARKLGLTRNEGVTQPTAITPIDSSRLTTQTSGSTTLSNVSSSPFVASWHSTPEGAQAAAAQVPGSTTVDLAQVEADRQQNLNTEQKKINEYNRLRASGMTDAEVRDVARSMYGYQSDDDWAYLVSKSRFASPTSSSATTTTTGQTQTGAGGATATGTDGTTKTATTGTTGATTTTAGTTMSTTGAKQFRLNIDTKTATPQQKAAEYNRLRSEGFTDAEIRSGVDTATGTKQTDADWTALQRLASTAGTTYPTATPATAYGPTGVPIAGATQQIQAQQTSTDGLKLDATNPAYQLGVAPTATVQTAASAEKADAGDVATGETYEAATALSDVQDQMNKLLPEKGTLSEGAKAVAQTGTLSEGAIAKTVDPATAASVKAPAPLAQTPEMLAEAATVADVGGAPTATAQTTDKTFTAEAAKLTGPTPEAVAATEYQLGTAGVAKMAPTKVEAAARADEIPTAIAEQSKAQSTVEAQQRSVDEKELVDVARQGLQITEPVQAVAAVADKLNQDAIAIAQQANFDKALASTEQGRVEAASTIQGQLTSLMQQFNDGTPAWAAGAMRQANAAMAARGLGGSSMAGAAIVQAAMEAATPIAAADAQVFAQMNLANLNNRQQVALANAAALQNLELANLNARQQAALQNSANAFALQSQNLSNQQAVVLANAQLRAAAQEKNLDIKTSVALTNAAKYAEVNNLNLTNRQQAMLQKSAENIQIDIANLNARQQTSLANLQVRAAIKGQELSNEQQMAVLKSTQNFEAAQIDATNQQQSFIAQFNADAALKGQVLSNQQQTALFNVSNVMRERELEFNAEQQTTLLNTTNAMQIELSNLSNKQQTALANAQIEAALKGQELSNKQQVNITNAARVAEIAQINFTAEQQNALANAQFIQQINLQDMSNQQAVVLANAAATAAMDMANLNAKQQAAVQNAQAFLAMDMANLDNAQKTALFKAQQLTQVALSDAAAENAAKQFNATSKQQADQFAASLTTQVSQFNAAQKNAMEQFNTGQENAMEQFNSQLKSQREQFNVTNRTVIDQANAQLLAQVSTANTAAVNAANFANAQSMNNMTMAQYNNEVMLYRDQVKMVYDSFERAEDRAASMATALLQADVAREGVDAQTSASYGKLIGAFLGTSTGEKAVDKVVGWLSGLFGG